MNGEILKTQLLKLEPTLVEVAKKLDISKQTLDSRLSANDVKTGFIEQLAKLYNRPIGFFFDDKLEAVANLGNGVQQYAGHDASYGTNMAEHDELIRLREENKFLKELMTDKNERIKELKERIEDLKAQLK